MSVCSTQSMDKACGWLLKRVASVRAEYRLIFISCIASLCARCSRLDCDFVAFLMSSIPGHPSSRETETSTDTNTEQQDLASSSDLTTREDARTSSDTAHDNREKDQANSRQSSAVEASSTVLLPRSTYDKNAPGHARHEPRHQHQGDKSRSGVDESGDIPAHSPGKTEMRELLDRSRSASEANADGVDNGQSPRTAEFPDQDRDNDEHDDEDNDERDHKRQKTDTTDNESDGYHEAEEDDDNESLSSNMSYPDAEFEGKISPNAKVKIYKQRGHKTINNTRIPSESISLEDRPAGWTSKAGPPKGYRGTIRPKDRGRGD